MSVSTVVWIMAIYFAVAGIFHAYIDARMERIRRAAIEIVIARQCKDWSAERLHAARSYAEGLVTGSITALTDLNDWERVPAALGYTINGTHDAGAWRCGIGRIHGLAHGVVEGAETSMWHGRQTDPHSVWFIYPEHLQDTGLTLDHLAAGFGGNLQAAASTFLRACQNTPAA